MFDTRLRPVKDLLITPLADAVGQILSPNGVSMLAFAAGIACTASLAFGYGMTAVIFWALNRVLDGLDGLIARRSGRASDAGGYLDIMLDFFVYAAIPLAMAWADASLAYACALLLAGFYVNGASWMYLSALLEKHGRGAFERGESTSVSMPAGVIEGGETIVFFTLMILVPAWRMTLFLLFAGLTIAGAALRFWQGFRLLQRMGGEESTTPRPPEQA